MNFGRWVGTLGGWVRSPEGKIILVGLALRIFLVPLFFHPDLKIILYISNFLGQGVVNIYDFLAAHPEKAILGPFYYPPLAYFSLGGVLMLLKPFLGGEFVAWLAQGNEAVATNMIFRYQLVTKLPLILAELATVWLVASWFRDAAKRRLALVLGIFNPLTLYATVAIGQFDILPALLTCAAVSLAKKEKWVWGGVMVGLAAALKTYPLLLLPFVVWAVPEGRERVRTGLAGVGVYLVTILPFIFSQAFRESVFLSGLAQRIFFAGVDLGFDRRVLVVVGVWVGLFLWWAAKKEKGDIAGIFLAVLALIFGFSHFHPQWLAWIGPFLIWAVVARPNLRLSVGMWIVAAFGLVALFKDKFVGLGLMSPIDPGIYFLPATADLMASGDWELANNLFQSALAGVGGFLAWQLLKREER